MDQHQPLHERLKHERDLRHWTQGEVAERIGSDPKSIRRWEHGQTVPGPYFRQRLAELFGLNLAELSSVQVPPTLREDWDGAPDVPGQRFYGRAQEFARVLHWIQEERCRVVLVMGMAGIGKTTFVTTTARKASEDFAFVLWRSLQNAPSLAQLVATCLQFISGQPLVNLPQGLEERIALLLTLLHDHRCLLVFDNVETLLQPGLSAGAYQPAHEGYSRLFQQIGETDHQSCLLLTSREKPQEIVRMEGDASPVRVLSLPGLASTEVRQLLEDRLLTGTEQAWSQLVHLYAGNPLALKLVAEPIREVFAGNVTRFVQEKEIVFSDVSLLLAQQFVRLSPLEQELMYWLAIEREEASFDDLRANILHPLARGAFPAALDSLRRRSLLETRPDRRFALQPVIMEYVTELLIERICQEIVEEAPGLLRSHALVRASSREYVRQSQVRFILAPVAARLLDTLGRSACAQKLKSTLASLHNTQKTDYAAANLLSLLLELHIDPRAYDFSHLTVRQAYLQNAALPEVNFSHADLTSSVFADTFSSIQCVAASPDGALLAAGTTTGEIWFWHAHDLTPLYTALGHTDGIRTIAFSADSTILASGGEDETVRLWDARTGSCLHVLSGHTSLVRSLAFSPIDHLLATGSEDTTIRLWNVVTGRCLRVLQGHTHWVRAVAFHPTGAVLASAGDDLTMRLWDVHTGETRSILQGHTAYVRAIAFTATGDILASGSEDRTLRLWDAATGEPLHVLRGHTSRIRSLAASSTGNILATGSDDATIRLWDAATGQLLNTLQGHTSRIWSVAFIPHAEQDRMLASASEDDTMRFWDVQSGQCLRSLQGYITLIKSVAFSPAGHILASGSEDHLVRLWDVQTGRCFRTLRGHTHRVRSIAFSPDGHSIASASEDETIRLWEVSTGRCRNVLRGHTHLVRSVAFSPDGSLLASAGYDGTVRLWDVDRGQCLKTLHGHEQSVLAVAFSPDGRMLASAGEDRAVHLWDVQTGDLLKFLHGHTHRVWAVAFSPDGRILASSSDDATLRLWDTATGQCIQVLQGHAYWVRCLAFSPDGATIASGSHDQTVRLWDARTGQCLKVLQKHSNWVWSVAFNPAGTLLASSSDDGTIRLWDLSTGKNTSILRSDGPYERMNITHATGLTEAQRASLKLLGAIEEED